MSLQKVQGSERTLANGSVLAKFRTTKADGTPTVVARIIRSSAAAAQAARSAKAQPITVAQAQAAFDRFYGRTKVTRRGAKVPRFASPRGRRSARTYDLGHSAHVIADSRYLSPAGPFTYDFQGVDAGSKARKVASASQLAALAAGRGLRGTPASSRAASPVYVPVAKPKAARKPRAKKNCKPCKQTGGYWW